MFTEFNIKITQISLHFIAVVLSSEIIIPANSRQVHHALDKIGWAMRFSIFLAYKRLCNNDQFK